MGAHLSQHAYIPTREASCCSFVCSAKTAWYLYLNQTVVPSQTKDKGKTQAAIFKPVFSLLTDCSVV